MDSCVGMNTLTKGRRLSTTEGINLWSRAAAVMEGKSPDPDLSKAELFEAMGHPTRIRLIQCLAKGPLGFSELKRTLGIESNGLLAFHLGKMGEFVRENAEGKYALTDYGIEALRLSYVLEKPTGNVDGRPLKIASGVIGTHNRKVIVAAVVLVVVLVVAVLAAESYWGSRAAIVSPLVLLSTPNVAPPQNFEQLTFISFYNATTPGLTSFYQYFKLNTTSFVTGSFTSTHGIDVFILPKDSEGTFSASLYKGLGSTTGFTYTTGPVTNGTINVTLTAGSWTIFVIDPAAQNSTLTVLQPIRVIALCDTGPVCGP